MTKEALLGLTDIGATQTRVAIADMNGHFHSKWNLQTLREDYEGTIQMVGDRLLKETVGGELVAVTSSVAATVTEEGVLTVSGALTPFLGNNLRTDIAAATGLPVERVNALNDMVVVAISQHERNSFHGTTMDGETFGVGSGFGGSTYTEDGQFLNVEPGHEHFRSGSKCPCGEDGHVEAFISGVGIQRNKGVEMWKYLQDPRNSASVSHDLAEIIVAQLERQRNANGFMPKEMRWTGSVVLNNPFLLRAASVLVKQELGGETPIFGLTTMGDQAGLHGSFVDAQNLALAA